MSLTLARCNREETNGAHNGGVGELRLSGDDRVGDVVIDGLFECLLTNALTLSVCIFKQLYLYVILGWFKETYRVSLLLNLQDGSILEGPLDNIGIGRSTLDSVAGFQCTPERAEALQLDEVPDSAEGSLYDGGFRNGSGGGNLR